LTPLARAILALFLVGPLALDAQGRRGSGTGGGSGAGTGGGGGPKRDPVAPPARISGSDEPSLSREIERANPVDALLDARKQLRLSREEETELKSINKRLKTEIKPFLKNLTSEAIDSVAQKYRAATDSALAKLTEEHRSAAKDLLQKKK
jgi:hypothetical protein